MEQNECMLILNQYYAKRNGYWPENHEDVNTTLRTIWYLGINEIKPITILRELHKCDKDKVAIEDLSESLWEGSLTEKGHYYFHRALQIISPPPVFSLQQGSKFQDDWCVPRLYFTAEDLTNYFWWKISPVEREMWILGHDTNKEIQYLLNRFKTSISNIEPLDYLLFLLDEMIRDENKRNIKGLISVTNYIGNTLETYRNTTLEANALGFDKPRWPSWL